MRSIAEENALTGTDDWWPTDHSPPGAIEGYATAASVRGGERVQLCIATRPSARYRLAVYRLGWYDGAGARLLTSALNVGIPRPVPTPDVETGLCRAGWPVTDSIYVDEDWTPGQYVALLTLHSGPHAGSSSLVPFVVRRAPAAPAPLIVQFGVNTSQAYNHWGGKSLYVSNSNDNAAAVKVSFDRPLPDWDGANPNARAPFFYDLSLIRFLEREGYETGYQTNVDTHREPWALISAQALISAAHDEYWTREIRDAWEHSRSLGVHHLFLGSNLCYWQIRYEDGERTLVEYRSKRDDPVPDRSLKTVRWRDLTPPEPESKLIGVQYHGGRTSPHTPVDYQVVEGAVSDPWGAALEDGAPVRGVVGYEWDGLDPDFEPPGLVRLLHCDQEGGAADCIRWRAPSGSLVFAAGSMALLHALDDWARPGTADPRIQTMLRTALNEMLSEESADQPAAGAIAGGT